ncbi:hypothetical protein BH23ACT10_BH23ACT10_14910 [soil metagenome]
MPSDAMSCPNWGSCCEITDDRIVLVADHLARCRRCGRDANGYRRLKARLSRLAAPLAPRELERLRTFADDLA